MMTGVLIISAVAVVVIGVLAYQLMRVNVNLGTYKATHTKSDKEHDDEIDKARHDAANRSRSVLRGQDLQVFAPWLATFPGKPNEARPVFAEIDYIVFRRNDNNQIDHIWLVEVKSGRARLSPEQRQIRDCGEAHRVSFKMINIDNETTPRDSAAER